MREPPPIHPLADAVFGELDRAGVRWCLLRGEDRLERPPHDIDILVAGADLAALARAIQPLGFCPLPTWARGSHRFFVAYFKAADHWLLLDVVTELAFGPGYAIRTGAGPAVLERRERLGRVAVPAADDAFWALLLHCLLDRGRVARNHAEPLRRLAPAAGTGSELARCVAAMCPPGWDAERVRALAATDPEALTRIAGPMTERWRRLHPLRFRARALADRLAWRIAPLHTLLAMRGLRVALVGDRRDAARTLATGLGDGFYFQVAPMEGSGGVALLRQFAQQARGRLVVVPLAAERNPVPARRFDLVVRVREADPAERRTATDAIWRTLAERRGWSRA